MPPKRNTRNKKAKDPVALTAQEQELRDQCDLLLKDFDKQCESLKAEAAREAKTAVDSIGTLYKLELMKIPGEAKSLLWSDYYTQHGGDALALSEAITAAVDDSVVEAVEEQVQQIKAVMTTVKKAGAGRRKRVDSGDENEQPCRTGTRSSSRGRTATSRVLETPGCASGAGKSYLETPATGRIPLAPLSTPMITPKFDTRSLQRTVSRTARAGEVLVSLSGSPVAPLIGNRSKVGAEAAQANALIPLGGGSTLNVPLTEGATEGTSVAMDLDSDQVARLQELHRSLGNMLKMRQQSTMEY